MMRNRNFYDIDLIKDIEVDAGGEFCLRKKMNVYYLYRKGVEVVTANILKQEMLSFGGDVAIHRQGITHKVPRTNILIMGTEQQIEMLVNRLEEMQFFELGKIQREIKELLKNLSQKEWNYQLPSGKKLGLFSGKTKIMGIINVTPDSFFSQSRLLEIDKIISQVEKMIKEGAQIIDIGGESTRPGAEKITEEEEIRRVIPAIQEIKKFFPDIIISIDTYKASVAKKAIEAGAEIVNDISALQFDSKMAEVVKDYDVPIILMHIKGTPQDMQNNPFYQDVIEEIMEYFQDRIDFCQKKGIKKIIIDPGIGFGKRLEDNLKIIKNISEFRALGKPILVGQSRKSFLGAILDEKNPQNRLEGTLAVTSYLAQAGIEIIRVHDVRENQHIIKTINAIVNI